MIRTASTARPPSIIKEKKTINLILLADSQNSLEALNDLIIFYLLAIILQYHKF